MKKRKVFFGRGLIVLFLFLFVLATGCVIETPTTDTSSNNSDNSTSGDNNGGGGGLVVSSPIYVVDRGSGVQFFGEVTNKDSKTHVFVQVNCIGYDSSNNQIAEKDTIYIIGDVMTLTLINQNSSANLKPGSKGYFVSSFDNVSKDQLSKIVCTPSSQDNTSVAEPKAKLEVLNIDASDDGGRVHFAGTVKNSGTKPLSSGMVYIFSKNSNREIIGYWPDFIDTGKYAQYPDGDTTEVLYPGDTGTFEFTDPFVNYSDYDSHTYKVMWYDVEIQNGVIQESSSYSPPEFSTSLIQPDILIKNYQSFTMNQERLIFGQ